jgi:hypothetical protein
MTWSSLSGSQMVSFTDAQGGGFTLQPGQSNITSNQCMTKSEALTKYVLDSSYMANYSDDQLVDKGNWVAGITGIYKGVLYDFSGTSNPEIYGITESGPVNGYERIVLVTGNTIKEYDYAPTVLCTDTPVSTVEISVASETFAKYFITNEVTLQIVGEFWMNVLTGTDKTTWQSSSTKKYGILELCT